MKKWINLELDETKLIFWKIGELKKNMGIKSNVNAVIFAVLNYDASIYSEQPKIERLSKQWMSLNQILSRKITN